MGKYLNSILSYTTAYLALQKAFGADRLRRVCVEILAPHPGERILDIGCGPAYILDYLPTVTYYGFDTEQRYIDYARQKYGDKGYFYCAQFTEEHAETLELFDAVMFMGLLHHLPDDACHNVVNLVSRTLKAGGRVVTLDPCFVDGQSTIARFVASHDRGRFVRDERGYLALVEAHFSEVKSRVVHNVGRLPSTEIIMHLTKPNTQHKTVQPAQLGV